MLIGQHGGGHQHGHLFRVASCLEGSANGYLGLAKPHVATHQAVHWFGLFHVGLHLLRGLQLVGGVVV